MSFGLVHQFNNYRAGSPPSFLQAANPVTKTDADCGATVTLSFPTTPTAGQFLVINAVNTIGAVSAPPGWTEQGTPNSACQTFTKIASGSESNAYDFIYNGSSKSDAMSIVGAKYSGVFATPIDVSASSSNTRTAPSVTTTQANELIMITAGSIVSATDYTTLPSGFTLASSNVAGTCIAVITHKAQIVAGASGTNDFNTGSYANAKVSTFGVRSQ